MLISKLKNSLTIKVFFITTILLIMACLFTYNFIAYYMPKTYSNELNVNLEDNIMNLIIVLNQFNLDDSPNLLKEFALENQADVFVFDQNQNIVKTSQADIPLCYNSKGNQEMPKYNNSLRKHISIEEEKNIDTEVDFVVTEGTSNTFSEAYDFQFANSKETFMLVVSLNPKQINEAAKALKKGLPFLIIVIFIISLFSAFFYSYYITRPIIKISRISKKMSELEFNWICNDKRQDEIGILAKSLNGLSKKLKTTLKELKDANISLQKDIHLKEELEQKRFAFFCAISHELKTPITIIKGQLEGMIYNIGVYQDREKYLKRALTTVNHMEDLVYELLAISRIESSEFVLKLESFNISALLKECLSEQEDFFMHKSLQLNTVIEDNLMIIADKQLLNKVFHNLIKNAVYYSPENNFIFLKLEKLQDSVLFVIENTGIHIPENTILKLFDAFYRVEQSRNKSMGGSGLGLYIVKMVLDLHKAEYKIENTASGVQFTFLLSEK